MDPLIGKYLAWLKICERSSSTIKARREILRRIDEELPCGLAAATADELQEWIYRDHWSSATRQTYYGAARSFFVWATNPHNPMVDFNPMTLLPRPSTPRALPRPVTDEQLARILTQSCEPYLTWSALAAYEGLRCLEIARLDRADITKQSLTVRKGKGGRPGVVPTHPAVWDLVRERASGPMALTQRGVVADAAYVSIQTALYFRFQLKMPGVALHRLRHWFGTTVYRQTRDLRRTQELLRHASPASTAIYTEISDEERREAVAALPVFTGAQQA